MPSLFSPSPPTPLPSGNHLISVSMSLFYFVCYFCADIFSTLLFSWMFFSLSWRHYDTFCVLFIPHKNDWIERLSFRTLHWSWEVYWSLLLTPPRWTNFSMSEFFGKWRFLLCNINMDILLLYEKLHREGLADGVSRFLGSEDFRRNKCFPWSKC